MRRGGDSRFENMSESPSFALGVVVGGGRRDASAEQGALARCFSLVLLGWVMYACMSLQRPHTL
jgi:hypothetical protein